jgi:mannose-6-phosphate isomerase-like protein (cupin superfamily)
MKLIRAAYLTFVPASHEDPQNPGVLKKMLLGRSDFIDGHVQMVNWAHLPVGKSFAKHYHETMQEIFVMIAGDVVMTVDDRMFPLHPGDAFVVDINEVHSMVNTGATDATYIVFGISQSEQGRTISVD